MKAILLFLPPVALFVAALLFGGATAIGASFLFLLVWIALGWWVMPYLSTLATSGPRS